MVFPVGLPKPPPFPPPFPPGGAPSGTASVDGEGEAKSALAEGVWTFDEISLLKAKWLADLKLTSPPPSANSLVDEGGTRRPGDLLKEVVPPLMAELGLSGEDGASARLALVLIVFLISICCTGFCFFCLYQICVRPRDSYPKHNEIYPMHPMHPMHFAHSAQGYVVAQGVEPTREGPEGSNDSRVEGGGMTVL